MKKSTPFARFGQAISGVALLAIATTAGATGFYINVNHGLEINTAAAVVFGLGDAAKIVLPIVCGAIGWNYQTRITAMICVAFSLFCAYNAYTSSSSQLLAGKQHGADQYAIAQATVEALEADVAKLDADARAEAARGGCGEQCKFLMERADNARINLSEARTALKQAKPVSVDQNANIKATVTALAFLFLIEALVWLSVPAMAALRQAMTAPKVHAKRKPAAKKSRAKKATAKQKAIKTINEAFPAYTKAGKIDGRTKAARNMKRAGNLNIGIPANA